MKKPTVFSVNTGLHSYIPPILKILISLLLILFLLFRNRIFGDADILWIKIALRALGVLLAILCVLRIYLSFAEIILVSQNRERAKTVTDRIRMQSRAYPVDELAAMAFENDVMIIQIIHKSRIVEIGSASDCKPGSSEFSDKVYYIEKEEFKDITDFRNALLAYSENDGIAVYSIDGLPVKE